MPVYLFIDVLQIGRENIARRASTTYLYPQVCDLIVHIPKYKSHVVKLILSDLYFI